MLLVHGLGISRYCMSPMRSYLQRKGYTVHVFQYDSLKGTIETHTRALAKYLETELKSEPDLHIVAHSLGSILTRKYISLFPDQTQIRSVIMLGPPNQGASMARIGLRLPFFPGYFGPVLGELASLSLPDLPGHISCKIITGGTGNWFGFNPLFREDNDGLVSVKEARLNGVADPIVVPVLHPLLVFSRSVMRITVEFLERSEP